MNSLTTIADTEIVINLLKERLAQIPKGTEAWHDVKFALDIRIERLNEMKASK